MAKQISPSVIKEAVLAEARVIKRKEEIYQQLVALNEEVQQLDERGMVGTFGFQNNPNDRMHKTKTGFVNDFQKLSHLARLTAEFEEQDRKDAEKEASLNELNQENEKLKQELEALKKKLDESKTDDSKSDDSAKKTKE